MEQRSNNLVKFSDFMKQKGDFHPGVPPKNRDEHIAGLKQAIAATKKRISDCGTDPDLEVHLKNLEYQLEKVQK